MDFEAQGRGQDKFVVVFAIRSYFVIASKVSLTFENGFIDQSSIVFSVVKKIYCVNIVVFNREDLYPGSEFERR